MAAMIFGDIPRLDEVLENTRRLEQIVNGAGRA
jgi:hypothetical protein